MIPPASDTALHLIEFAGDGSLLSSASRWGSNDLRPGLTVGCADVDGDQREAFACLAPPA